MELRLATVEPVHAAINEGGVLFEGDTQFLAAPFGQVAANVQLNRIAGVVVEAIIAAPWYAVLLIPEADGRASSVPMIAERVAVDLGLLAFAAGLFQRGMQHFVASEAGPHLRQMNFLQAIAERERAAHARGRIDFAGAQHVSVLLMVGGETQIVKTDIAPEQIAGLDEGALFGGVIALAARLNVDIRLEPGLHPKTLHGLTQPPAQIFGGGNAGMNDPRGKQGGDQFMRHRSDAIIGV